MESEDESETKNLDFAPKMRTLRQRMTEDMGEFVVFLPEALFWSLEPRGTCPVRSEALLLRALGKRLCSWYLRFIYMGHKRGLGLTGGGAGYFEKCLQNYFWPC